jgi:hypothetical protein
MVMSCPVKELRAKVDAITQLSDLKAGDSRMAQDQEIRPHDARKVTGLDGYHPWVGLSSDFRHRRKKTTMAKVAGGCDPTPAAWCGR